MDFFCEVAVRFSTERGFLLSAASGGRPQACLRLREIWCSGATGWSVSFINIVGEAIGIFIKFVFGQLLLTLLVFKVTQIHRPPTPRPFEQSGATLVYGCSIPVRPLC